jgi:hypothetical protein
MLQDKNVKLEIISNPKVNSTQLGFEFNSPQQLGGLKREITVRRNKLQKLVDTKAYTYTSLSEKLGVSTYHLRRFLGKETIKRKDSYGLYNGIYANDLDEMLIETETEPKLFTGANKEKIRYKFYEEINKSKITNGKFFTLPGDTCRFEYELNSAVPGNKFHYISVEYDTGTYYKARKRSVTSGLHMSLTLNKASEVLLDRDEEAYFNHMFLDYCGTFTTYENEVRHVIDKNLVKVGGLIGLTLSLREANTKQETCIDYHRKVLEFVGSDNTPSTLNGIRLKLMSFIGNNYEMSEFIDYRDTSSMVFVLLKRLK